MKVYVYGSSQEAELLHKNIAQVLEDLGLSDFVELEKTQDETLKNELHITQESACIIEEESINFKDMIFEGLIPEHEEIKAMFLSIIGWGEHSGGGCGTGGCGSGCSC